MLKRSYEKPEMDEQTQALANEVTLLIVGSNVTYRKAMDVLEFALFMLEEKTRLVIDPAPVKPNSESLL